MILSMFANTLLEDVAASVPEETLLFMQLSFLKDRSITENVVKRVNACGRFKAIAVTIDQPFSGTKLSRATHASDVKAVKELK